MSIALTTANAISASQKVFVVDAENSTPIEGATVISATGMIIGITDRTGAIRITADRDYPLEIRSIGYEPFRLTAHSDTAALSTTTYPLPEITVQADERPIMKLTSYAREYSSGATPSDTIQLYAEYMFVSYHTDDNKKMKGFKGGDRAIWPRAVRRYARYANSEGLDSVSRPDKHDNASFLSFYDFLIGAPVNSFPETDAIAAGAKTDSVMGKHYPFARYAKTNDSYFISYDKLADHKDHRVSPTIFKIVGMTMDIDRLQTAFQYRATNDSLYTLNDFLFCSGSLHAQAKGKMFKWMVGKKDLEVDCYAELYPVEIEYLTVDEYKEDRKEKKDRTPIPFNYPKHMQPFPLSIQKIIERTSAKP